MKDTKAERAQRGAAMLRRQFLQGDGSLFDQVLDDQTLAPVLAAHGTPSRERLYPPLQTLRLFIGQVLSVDRACQDVVGRRLSERVAQGQPASALNTGSYCDARSRLPIALPTTLGRLVGQQMESLAPSHWRWQGRCVKLFDGTTVSMPDTPDNQQAWPQSREQKPGLGFPLARIGALIGLASGAVLHYQISACKGKGTGEQSLLQNLLPHLDAGDVLLADALLATWWIIEAASRQGADVVMAQHGRRITDFTRGSPLGKKDHIVQWPRPPKPKTMSAEDYARYPEFMVMREIEVNGRILVTTCLIPDTPRLTRSMRSTGCAGTSRWTFAPSRSRCRWMYCVASRKRWWRRKSQSVYWPTTWCVGQWQRRRFSRMRCLAR